MMMRSQIVKVQLQNLAGRITCPLCKKPFTDATVIPECHHTFCKKFIYQKFTDEGLNSCPVCKVDLGGAPLQKLRPDKTLQDLRDKIFPSNRQKAKATEAVPPIPLPTRRKERSLSSLAANMPKGLVKSTLTRGIGKCIPGKYSAPKELKFNIEEAVTVVKDLELCLSSSKISSKILTDREKNNFVVEASIDHVPENAESQEEITDSWKPLNRLVEAATNIELNKLNSPQTAFTLSLPDAHENGPQAPKTRRRQLRNKSKVHGEESNSAPDPPGLARPKRSRQRRGATSEGSNILAQSIVNSNSILGQRFSPIWFSLVASDDQEGDLPLPQISPCYLRVKNGSLPVSFIKKYLVKKLNLASESEVEISLRGQPMLSTMQLHNLVELWQQTAQESGSIQTTVGSSAKEFIMILSYGRKAPP
ncbi:putative DREB2A-interacting protein 2 [Tripterygium wilfordii]|uniref:Putative DREB2A-interacting protein 2 n=1 Tax=Tripterygium wilfordii TaxID=458696 RepID=A0A7J7CX35_TRIWF|nr:E3 ubiquitin protein ligase DRIP2-like [Tripterygium wilfordii]KAF5738584.1 putative DREB2A-interacting protein 2 [Tripterygium wilfordii]